jgi:Tol biopolymer transport system component
MKLNFSFVHKLILAGGGILLVSGAFLFLHQTHATLLPNANDILNANKSLLLFSAGGGNNFVVASLRSSEVSPIVSDFGNSKFENAQKWLYLSPDRKLIAVTLNPIGGDSTPCTYISDVNGTQLTEPWSGDFVSWAPDSSKVLLYVSPLGAPWDRFIYSLDTKNNYSNSGLPNGTISADISPADGSILYSFTSGGMDASTLYLRDPQGNDKVLVKGDNSILAWVRWSPKGDKIAFMKSDLLISSGRQSVWVMRSDGTGQKSVSSIDWDYPPVWSPDGTKVAFSNEGNIGEYDAVGRSLRNVMNLRQGGAAHPSYSSDGKTIVFASSVSGESQIWAAQDGGVVQLTSGNQEKNYPILP